MKQRLDRGEKFLLVDVREPWEHQICRIEGAQPVPLRTIPEHLALFEEAEDVVLYCHHGMRSRTPRRGCNRRKYREQSHWRAGSSAGQWRLIRG